MGLTYQLSSDAYASLILPIKCLVVLDDLERCPDLPLHDLCGLISNLVEGQGKKVLLVYNDKKSDYLEKDDERSETIATLEEKLVWVRYHFEPDSNSIVESIMDQNLEGLSWRGEALAAIEHAFSQTGSNIRSLKKTRKLIGEILKTEFMQDDNVDHSRKVRVVGTVVLLALRYASGKPPIHEENVQPQDYNALVIAGVIDPLEEKLAGQLARLPFIAKYFAGAYNIELDATETAIKEFADSEYPESQVELKALRGEELLRMSLPEDEEVMDATKAIMEALSSEDVRVVNIPRMLKALLKAKEYGLLEDSEFEKACNHSEQILMGDPVASYATIKSCGFEWATNPMFVNEELQEELRRLIDLVKERNDESWYSDVMANISDKGELSGQELADAFVMCDEIVARLPRFPVENLVAIVSNSNMVSISALRDFFQSTFSRTTVDETLRNGLVNWLGNASNGLRQLQVPSRMRSLSIEFFANDLESIRKRIDS